MTTIILHRPQMGENIGMTARAMLNCGLTQLRIVAPRDGWPNPAAVSASAGADDLIHNAKIFPDLRSALADLQFVYATCANHRGQAKPVHGLGEAAENLLTRQGGHEKTGILFGPERSGLDNEDLSLCDALLTIPLNPDFNSLNLSQAVLLVAHSLWERQGRAILPPDPTPTATRAEVLGFLDRLENMLVASEFLRHEQKRPGMVRNIRNLFHRASLKTHEVGTLHGILTSLALTEPKAFDRNTKISMMPVPSIPDDENT